MEANNLQSVTEVVWPWRQPPEGTNKNKGLWKRALIQAAVIAAVAGMLFYWEHKTAAGVVWTIAGAFLVCGITMPRIYEKIDRFGQQLGHWAGVLLTWILLVPFFYLCFCPCALFFKKRTMDNFSPEFRGQTDSYWVGRSSDNTKEQYKRQF
jgi:RsiW-degrading membrane proteinase PrsW (M82 family)